MSYYYTLGLSFLLISRKIVSLQHTRHVYISCTHINTLEFSEKTRCTLYPVLIPNRKGKLKDPIRVSVTTHRRLSGYSLGNYEKPDLSLVSDSGMLSLDTLLPTSSRVLSLPLRFTVDREFWSPSNPLPTSKSEVKDHYHPIR